MTPKVAQTKICPHMTYIGNEQSCYSSNFAVYYNSNCQADSCMAWQWVNKECIDGFCGLSTINYEVIND